MSKESEKAHEMCPTRYQKGSQIHQSGWEIRIMIRSEVSKKLVRLSVKGLPGFVKVVISKILDHGKEIGFSGQ